MPRMLTNKKRMRNGRRSCDRIEIPGAITSEEYPSRLEVLNMYAMRVTGRLVLDRAEIVRILAGQLITFASHGRISKIGIKDSSAEVMGLVGL
ncbi:hypothetical protein Tco_0948060 [Tanacetum coccineum]